MGRFDGCDEYDSAQEFFFRSSLERAIKAKSGQRILREMAEILLAMPERKLAYGAIATEAGEVCAVGAYARAKGADLTPYVDCDDDYGQGTISLGRKVGMLKPLAEQLAWLNDYYEPPYASFRGFSDEQRWQKIYEWVTSQVKWSLPVPA